MKRRKLSALLAIPVAAVAIGFSTLPAQASSPSPAAPIHASNAGILAGSNADGYVVVNRAAAQHSGTATFYPTGQLSSSTLVVIPNDDGSLPGGLTIAKLQALHAGAGTAAGVAAANKAGFEVVGGAQPAADSAKTAAVASPAASSSYSWSATAAGWSKAFSGGNIIGINSSAKAAYSFTLLQGYSGNVAGQGLGYYQGYNGSLFGTWSQFYHLTAANPTTTGGGLVPWGNVAATAKFEAQCATNQICGGSFSAGF